MIRAINGLAHNMRRRVARASSYKRTMRELSSLTNRELADIGISRFDIPRIAAEHAESIHV
jgi:uncharacterized protein YjiS (DUF1127 family)